MADITPPRPHPRPLGHLCILRSSLFPGPGRPRSSAEVWCGVGRARVVAQLRLGSAEQKQTLRQTRPLPSLPGVSQHPCSSPAGSPGFSSLSICPSGSPRNKRLVSYRQDPRTRTPCLWLSRLTPQGWCRPRDLPFPLSPLPGAQVPTRCSSSRPTQLRVSPSCSLGCTAILLPVSS